MMGEAKRRFNCLVEGKPYVPAHPSCPACGSLKVSPLADVARLAYEGCLDCRAVWEARGPNWIEDAAVAEPCDNCAFRPGSPEQSDPQKWRELLASLGDDPWSPTGEFWCHKGVPIDLQNSGFLFVFNANGQPDRKKNRLCGGYIRMRQAQARKRRVT